MTSFSSSGSRSGMFDAPIGVALVAHGAADLGGAGGVLRLVAVVAIAGGATGAGAAGAVVTVVPGGLLLGRGTDDHGGDPHAAAAVLAALGPQAQSPDLRLHPRPRHPAETLCHETADGLDVVIGQVDVEQLAQIVDPQPRGDAQGVLAELLHLGPFLGVGLVGDLADDLLEDVLDGQQSGRATVLVDGDGH